MQEDNGRQRCTDLTNIFNTVGHFILLNYSLNTNLLFRKIVGECLDQMPIYLSTVFLTELKKQNFRKQSKNQDTLRDIQEPSAYS